MIRLDYDEIARVAASSSPRELREKFRAALADEIMQAGVAGHVELAVAEELLRALPPPS